MKTEFNAELERWKRNKERDGERDSEENEQCAKKEQSSPMNHFHVLACPRCDQSGVRENENERDLSSIIINDEFMAHAKQKTPISSN